MVRIRVPVLNTIDLWSIDNIYDMSKVGTYVQESYDELVHKVTWPSWEELQQTTVIVLVALTIITLLLLGMDTVSEYVLKALYGLLGK